MATKTSNRVTKNTAPAASTEAKTNSVLWGNLYVEINGTKVYLPYGLPFDAMFAKVQEKLDNGWKLSQQERAAKGLMDKFQELTPGERITVDKLKVELFKVNTDKDEFTDDDFRF